MGCQRGVQGLSFRGMRICWGGGEVKRGLKGMILDMGLILTHGTNPIVTFITKTHGVMFFVECNLHLLCIGEINKSNVFSAALAALCLPLVVIHCTDSVTATLEFGHKKRVSRPTLPCLP